MLFNQNFLNEIRQKLLLEKKRLEEELTSFAHKNPRDPNDFQTDFPQFGSDEDENASEVTAFSDSLTVERTLEKELQDIAKALERLDGEKYGTCKYCNKTIPEKRLLVRPTSSACIDCKKGLTLER